MARLPQPGADNGQWGTILNDYLSMSLESDGTLKPIGQSNIVNLQADLATKATTANLAPVATSGTYTDLTAKPTIPSTPTEVGAEPAGLSATTLAMLGASYAKSNQAVYGPRTIFDGDSITLNGITTGGNVGASNQDRSNTWTAELTRSSMGRIDYVWNAAVAGQRSDDMLARFDTIVAPKLPQTVIATIGTNDVGQGRTQAEWLADIESYRLKCVAIGARLIVGEIWPTTDNTPAGRTITTRLWNDALHTWAVQHSVDVIPWQQLCDPITGGWPTTWTSDNIHPGLLDSYAQIGRFAWNFLKNKYGVATVRRAVATGADQVPNGFFTTLDAGKNPPNTPTLVPTTGTGSLPAGTYSYKLTALTYYGESLPNAGYTATLASTGQIAITTPSVSQARGYRVFRKAPSDTDWYLVGTLEGGLTVNFTDDGTATPGVAAPTVDSSKIPVGLTVGSTTRHVINGPFLFTETGIRGNIMRIRPYITGTSLVNDFFSISVVAGEVYHISALLRSYSSLTEGAYGQLILRWRDAGGAIGQICVYRCLLRDTEFGLVSLTATVPTGAITVRISFEVTSTADYVDVAEVRFAKLN